MAPIIVSTIINGIRTIKAISDRVKSSIRLKYFAYIYTTSKAGSYDVDDPLLLIRGHLDV